ncbi:hypothetical protein A1O1_03097 [Capronia coronata CBS 617.96]|uniref:Uncharacterized protein n=1 Tax=Capronia coronata CBS 617.96 TaxID=1182541 RepID=W9YYC8_9EURO|nr:uncharacterized protein A1O1_03097 [Capronia coronata CBS 617.96]EXJ94700.1 hypothetical protein A1O1_03097 [Capronia coronata CBS 617.96]
MAEENGVSQQDDTISVSTTHLGKRKRTVSPDPAKSPTKVKDSPLQAALQEVLRTLRKHDSTPSLLNYPLPSTVEAHDPKRARLAKTDSQNDTIESRILAGTYSSFHALLEDLNTVKDAIIKDLSEPSTNGTTQTSSPPKPGISDRLTNMVKLVSMLDNEASKGSEAATTTPEGEDLAKTDLPGIRSRHVLSLRSQVNGGAHLLYSGLETGQLAEEVDVDTTPEVDGVTLPNGFELTDFADLGGDGKQQSQEKRLFGTVFRPSSRLKPLETPRPPKTTVRGGTLDFIPYWAQIEKDPRFPQDYRFARLPTGSWLSYGGSGTSEQHDQKRSRQLSVANDFKAALEGNDVQQRSNVNADALYASVYSSFAPCYDNSVSIYSEKERARHWYRKYGEQKLSRIFRVSGSVDSTEDAATAEEEKLDNFEEAVANYEPVQEEEAFPVQKEPEDVDDLLQQVSELLETLASYQKNRSLEPVVSGSVPKPTEPEIDMFEVLKSQLRILVSTLPPFAVAKLDGDQLEALNISTTLLVEPPDYPGTSQVEDHTLRRQKVPQQAPSAASRPTVTPQLRPNYGQAPVSTGGYNTQVRNYNAVPATAGYGMRGSYQTPTVPRPAYSQTPYQQSGNPYPSRPTIQQFQRPVQNGYGNYGGTPVQAQTPGFVQRPGQPGYQQRPQDNSMANVPRAASPQKPIVNGQLYAPRQYPGQQAQSPYPFQRQGSGTPGTPGVLPQVGTPYGRYDGGAAQVRTAGGGSVPPANQAQVQAPMPAQTVEGPR